MHIIWKCWSCWAAAQGSALRSFGWVLFGVPRLIGSLAGDLASQRCSVKHLIEDRHEGVCVFRRKQLHIINEQRSDKLRQEKVINKPNPNPNGWRK